MPDFDIDQALAGSEFTFAGNSRRQMFWAKRDDLWVPVASVAESSGTWAVMTFFFQGRPADVEGAARERAKEILKMSRTATPEEWQPVLEALWHKHGAAFNMSKAAINWQYCP